VELAGTVEIGVERVSQFATGGFIAGDCGGGGVKLRPVESDEAIPGRRVAVSAGAGEEEIFHMQALGWLFGQPGGEFS